VKLRGGQVYYLFNDVENIQKAADKLAELVPERGSPSARADARARAGTGDE
jgi:transcription-repair coupling factor (superfamily II helicase)